MAGKKLPKNLKFKILKSDVWASYYVIKCVERSECKLHCKLYKVNIQKKKICKRTLEVPYDFITTLV